MGTNNKIQVEVDRVYQIEGAPKKIVLGQILKLNPKGSELLKQADSLTQKPIDKQGVADVLNILVAKLKRVKKFLSDTKLEYTTEWRRATKEANEKYAEAMKPIDERIINAAAAVRVWDDEQERIQREAEEQARKEAEEAERKRKAEEERRRKISTTRGGVGNITPVPVEPIKKIVPYAARQSTQYRKNWVAEITSFAKLPDEFKMVNTVKLNEAMRNSKDKDGEPQAVILGVEWKCEKVRVG